LTSQELATYDGRDGRPAYVAVSGRVYDLSDSSRWVEGNHEGVHQAGQDLTEALKSAPHIRAVIERFPLVGTLEEPNAKPHASKKISMWPIFITVVVLLGLMAIFL